MERKGDYQADDQAPDPSVLWLAIGIGAFSVFASFFLAVYSSTDSDTPAHDQHALEASAEPTGR